MKTINFLQNGLALLMVIALGGCGDGASQDSPTPSVGAGATEGASTTTPAGEALPNTLRLRAQVSRASDQLPSLEVTQLTKVSERRVGRTIYEYTWHVEVKNMGDRVENALLKLAGVGAGSRVVDGLATVGALEAGSVDQLQDTVSFLHDRAEPFEISAMRWEVAARPVEHPVSTLAEVGVTTLTVGENNAALVATAGAPVMTQLALDSAAQVVVSAPDRPDAQIVSIGAGQFTIRWVTSPTTSGAEQITLRVANAETGAYTPVPLSVSVLPHQVVATGTLGRGETVLTTDRGDFTFSSNSLTQPVGVRVLRTDAGTTTRYTYVFDTDVRQAGLTIKPPTMGVFDPESAPGLGKSRALRKTGSCVPVRVNSNPYSSVDQNRMSSTEPAFSTAGLGSELWSRTDLFVVVSSVGVDVGDIVGASFRVASSDQRFTVDLLSTSVSQSASGYFYSVTTEVKPAVSLDTVLVSSATNSCTGIDIVTDHDWSVLEPVLFVHGFTPWGLGGGYGTWGHFPRLALQTKTTEGKTLVPFEFHWNTNADFKQVATDLGKAINLIYRKSNKKVHVVAHSFGGVLTRVLLQGPYDGSDRWDVGGLNGDMLAAKSAVASLTTLGSPHSGILDADGLVSTIDGTELPFPKGQDAATFEFCQQVTCWQMGEPVRQFSDINGRRGFTGDDWRRGGIAAQLATTTSRLPSIPISVGIGLASTPSSFGVSFLENGDRLITFEGQRFMRHDSTSSARSDALMVKTRVGNSLVSEVLLGYESQPSLRPGDSNVASPLAQFSRRSRGYLHSSTTGVSNLGSTDGGFLLGLGSTWSRGFNALFRDAETYLPDTIGIEAAPLWECETVALCEHAGFKLFRLTLANLIDPELIAIQREPARALGPLMLNPAKLIGKSSRDVAALQAILDELKALSVVSGAAVRWDLVPIERMSHFNAELSRILGSNAAVDEVVGAYSSASAELGTVRANLAADANGIISMDRQGASAVFGVLTNSAKAVYGAVQVGSGGATSGASLGLRIFTKVPDDVIRRAKILERSTVWAEFLQACGETTQAAYRAAEASWQLPAESADGAVIGEGLQAALSCVTSSIDLVGDDGPKKLKALVSLIQARVDHGDGTFVPVILAFTDVVDGVIAVMPSNPGLEVISGMNTIVSSWADTYQVATQLALHMDEVVSMRVDRVNSTFDRIDAQLLRDRVAALVPVRARGLFVSFYEPTTDLPSAVIAASPTGATIGESVQFVITNVADYIGSAVRAVWQFGVEATVTVTDAATSVAHAFVSTGAQIVNVVLYGSSGEQVARGETTVVVACPPGQSPQPDGRCAVGTSPSVTSVEPLAAVAGVPRTFAVAGANLPAGLSFQLSGCLDITEVLVGGTTTQRQFTCTFPAGTAEGTYRGAVATSSSPFGPPPLREFEVTVVRPRVIDIAPKAIMRTLAGSFDIIGTNLPTSGLTVAPLGDSRSNCQAPHNLTVNGFGVACELYRVGAQTLEVRHGANVLGNVVVNVSTNVSRVTWTSPSTADSGTVKFGETVTFSVLGTNLTADPLMGFAVEKCGVSNTELGAPTETLRRFTCTFNNEAGAVAGVMPGVVKDSYPDGQVLLEGWGVPVEVPAGVRRNLFLGAPVATSTLCDQACLGANTTDGDLATLANLGQPRGNFVVALGSPVSLGSVRLVSAMHGAVDLELRTHTDPAAPTGGAGWTSHYRATTTVASGVGVEFPLGSGGASGVRQVEVLVHSAASYAAFYEIEGYGESTTSRELLVHLMLDGDARDTSGNGRDGVVSGATATSDRFGSVGAAMQLGTSRLIHIPGASVPSSAALTASAWIKLDRDVGATQARIVNRQSSSGGVESWGLEVFGAGYGGNASGNKVVFHAGNGSTAVNVMSVRSLAAGRWYHVAGVHDGAQLRIYIDGVLDASAASTGPLYATNTTDVVIGKSGPINDFWFPGAIDDVRLYGRALGVVEVAAMSATTNPANGRGYQMIECGTWNQCQTAARARGGELVTIRSAAENDWLVSTFMPQVARRPGGLWIGLSDAAAEGVWQWSSGEAVTYSRWSAGQPDNRVGDEDYAHLYASPDPEGFWNDIRSDGQGVITQAIVEYAP